MNLQEIEGILQLRDDLIRSLVGRVEAGDRKARREVEMLLKAQARDVRKRDKERRFLSLINRYKIELPNPNETDDTKEANDGERA